MDSSQDFNRYRYQLLGTAIVFALFAICVMSGHWMPATQAGSFDSTEAASDSLLALACFAGAGTVGFLFGLPSAVQKMESSGYNSQPNNNLDKISDWLTKTILGLSLVNCAYILVNLDSFAELFDADFGVQGAHHAYAVGVMGVFLSFGFLFGYIGTRSVLTMAIAGVDRAMIANNLEERIDDVQQKIDRHCKVDYYVEECRNKRHEKKWKDARNMLNHALELAPKDEAVLIEKAKISMAEGQFEEAKQILDELLDHVPDSFMALYSYGVFIIQHHYDTVWYTSTQMPGTEVQKVCRAWKKAFEQVPELKHFAEFESTISVYLPKEPAIYALVQSP